MRELFAHPKQYLHQLANREVVVADQMCASRREVSHHVRAYVTSAHQSEGAAANSGAYEATPILREIRCVHVTPQVG